MGAIAALARSLSAESRIATVEEKECESDVGAIAALALSRGHRS